MDVCGPDTLQSHLFRSPPVLGSVPPIRICSGPRECGKATTFPSISAKPYLRHSLRSVDLPEFNSIRYQAGVRSIGQNLECRGLDVR